MIDFAAIADAFRQPFLEQTAPTVRLFEKLTDAVKDLVEKSDNAERATRAYPILRYRNGAVGMQLALTPSVIGTFTDPGVGSGFSRLHSDVSDALRSPGVAVQQERALGDIIAPVMSAVLAVEASLIRHDHADPSIFDRDRVRFRDLFGIVNLGWSSLLGDANQRQIKDAAGEFAKARGSGPATPTAAGTDTVASISQLGIELDGYAIEFMQAILIAPVLIGAVDVLMNEGVNAAEEAILREVGGIENQVYGLRSDVVDVWLVVFDVGSVMHYTLAASAAVLAVDDLLISYAVPIWCNGLLDSFERFLRGISYWGTWTGLVVTMFQVATNDLMSMDLLGSYLTTIMPGWLVDLLPVPSVTLDDIVAYASGEGDPQTMIDIQGWLIAAEALLAQIPGSTAAGYLAQLDDVRTIVGFTMLPTPFPYPPDVLPTAPLAPFPDLYEAFFSGTRRADFLSAVSGFGVAAHDEVITTLRGGADLMTGIARTATDEAERQAQFGAGLSLARAGDRSVAVVGDLFGGLRSEVTAAAAPAGLVGAAFDSAAAAVGIQAAIAAIPAFVSELRSFWQARVQARPQPTSPHILARRARLGAVRIPSLTVSAHDRHPNQALADTTGERFHTVVAQAYRDGMARIAADAAELDRTEHPRRSRTRASTRPAGGGR